MAHGGDGRRARHAAREGGLLPVRRRRTDAGSGDDSRRDPDRSLGGGADLRSRARRADHDSARPMSLAADSEVRVYAGPRPVPWLQDARPSAHGSFDASAAEAAGVGPEDVLDFSANGNVIGPSPMVAA